MGPRSFDRGNQLERDGHYGGRLTSMGPRSFDRGNIRSGRSAAGVATLQWGRGLLTAETRRAKCEVRWEDFTSMGPRSFDRGNVVRMLIADMPIITSMGPRSFDRGNTAASRRSTRFLRTSMGPRSFDRGNEP